MKAMKHLGWAILIGGLAMLGLSGRMAHAQIGVPQVACGPIHGTETWVKNDTWYLVSGSYAGDRVGVDCVYDYSNPHPNALDMFWKNWKQPGKGCPTTDYTVKHYAMMFGPDDFTPQYYWYDYTRGEYPVGSGQYCQNTCNGVAAGQCTGGANYTRCNGGQGNYYVVKRSVALWEFRQLHVWHTGDAYDKWASSAYYTPLGVMGATGCADKPHVHADNRYNGTRMQEWYTDVGTKCATPSGLSRLIGHPRLD